MARFSYAVIGTGAIGGYYGGRLARSGAAVHFLAHSDYDHVATSGLTVESKAGNFRLPSVNVYRDAGAMPRCDVALVCLKSTQNSILPNMLPLVLKDDGVAVLMQNGMGAEEEIARHLGPGRVAGGLCFICTRKAGPGHIVHTDYGSVRFGAYRQSGIAAQKLPGITQDFRAAEIEPVEVARNLAEARWHKLVWNIPFNAFTILLGRDTGQLLADEGIVSAVQSVMEEIAEGAKQNDVSIAEAFIGRMIADTRAMVPYVPSMKLDYDARKPMEVDAIFGEPVRRMHARGYAAPRITMLYQMLRFMDERNRVDR